MKNGIGDLFQEETKYRRGGLPSGGPAVIKRPQAIKRYPSAVRIALPQPEEIALLSLGHALKTRRSVRSYAHQALSKQEVSLLLWAGQGVTGLVRGFPLRAAPSAGALYPVETYLVVQLAQDIPPGVYHYGVLGHDLELITAGDLRAETAGAALDQGFIASAGVVFIWTAVFDRSKGKYGERAYRYIYLDAGHIAQNVALAAAALGLGSCPIAALYDDEVNALVGVDGRAESVLYMTSVGRIA